MAGPFLYEGKKVALSLETIALPGGVTVQKEVVHHRGAVVLIPWVDNDRICMVRNHRHAIGQTLLELPAGTLDPGETPEATAVRELQEETGYRAGYFRKVAEFYPSPGILTELMHLFVMEGLQPGQQQLDEGEQLEPLVLLWSEAVRLALNGTIRDGKTLVGVLLWDRLRGNDQ